MTKNTIKIQGNGLKVPNHVTIPFIEGDGIGKDITQQALQVIDRAVERAYKNKKILWKEVLAGSKAYENKGEHLPTETISSFKNYKVGIKGPLTTPVGRGFRSLNVALRQNLDLYVCLRPVSWIKDVPSPIKHPENVNLHIFRENTEDIYAGIEYKLGQKNNAKCREFLIQKMNEKRIRFPDSTAFGIKPISKAGTERLVRAAIQYGLDRNLPFVTLVHKGNIMKYTEGAFKEWGYDLAAKEFGDSIFSQRKYNQLKQEAGQKKADQAWEENRKKSKLILKDVIADAFFQELLLRPEQHSVVATMNLNGDYISDMAAAMVGGIGISPGANINYDTGVAIFEATHGTAPDIMGTGKANPTSFLLSSTMMLSYLGWDKAAKILEAAIIKQIHTKRVTEDLYIQMRGPEKLLTTGRFMEEIIENI